MKPKPPSTLRQLLAMARYGPWIAVLHGALWAIFNLSSLLPGLIGLAFFDAITGQARVPLGGSELVLLRGQVGFRKESDHPAFSSTTGMAATLSCPYLSLLALAGRIDPDQITR